jgi:hypothetical protein
MTDHGPVQGARWATLEELARYSRAIEIGIKAGFNSFEYVDYIYANRASGRDAFAALIDRCFLSHETCAALRSRLALTTQAIRDALAHYDEARLLDLAAGTAPYLWPQTASGARYLAGDQDQDAIDRGAEIARQRSREDIEFVRLNAFSCRDLPDFPADVVVTSGFFGFLPEPAIRRVFHVCADATRNGSRWVFNVQHAHPGLEDRSDGYEQPLLKLFTNREELKSAETIANCGSGWGWTLESTSQNRYFTVGTLVRANQE